MEIRKDLLGKIPEIGNIIAYNPPKYKGLEVHYVIGFSKTSGLPITAPKNYIDVMNKNLTTKENIDNWLKEMPKWNNTPKTGFIIINV